MQVTKLSRKKFLSGFNDKGSEEQKRPNLWFATNNPIISLGVTSSISRRGDTGTEATFNIVGKLSVSTLIKTNLIYKYITCIYLSERKLTSLELRPLPILSRKASSKFVVAVALFSQKDATIMVIIVRVIWAMSTWRLQNQPQPVNSGQRRTYFEPDEQLAQRKQVLFAIRIIEAQPNHLLYILLVYSRNTNVHLPRYMLLDDQMTPYAASSTQRSPVASYNWLMNRTWT